MQEKNEPSKTQFVKRYDVDGGRGVVAAFRYIKDGKKIQSFHGFSTRYGKVKKYRITYVDDAAIRGASPDAPELTNQQAMYNVPQSAPAVNTAEYTDVYNRYHNADGTKKPGWMKAPNGKPTNLTVEQWVWVRTPNFKKWFGDWENDPVNASKVVDENGEPRVVYRGDKKNHTKYEWANVFHATNEDTAATYGEVVQSNFINAKNPLIVDADGAEWLSIDTPSELKSRFEDGEEMDDGRGFTISFDEMSMSIRDMAMFAKKAGYDALIVKNVQDSYEGEEIITDDIVCRASKLIFYIARFNTDGDFAKCSQDSNRKGDGPIFKF